MQQVWLVGASGMAQDYVRVLNALGVDPVVIGRGKESATVFQEATGCPVITGGLEKYLLTKPVRCSHAIVSVGIEALAETALRLIRYGVGNILVEKPGGLTLSEVQRLVGECQHRNCQVFVAYNRRFFASVLKAKEMIAEDGGITSFNFEFTEWSHVIEKLTKAEGVKERWFLANSTHVVDLAFYLGGPPRELCAYVAGGVDWHPSGVVFAGAGTSETGALFSYQANWKSGGRWAVELSTNSRRLILRPMEQLHVTKVGSITCDLVQIDDALEKTFKPGLYVQVDKFLSQQHDALCSIDEQLKMMKHYYAIANYVQKECS